MSLSFHIVGVGLIMHIIYRLLCCQQCFTSISQKSASFCRRKL